MIPPPLAGYGVQACGINDAYTRIVALRVMSGYQRGAGVETLTNSHGAVGLS